MTSEEKIDDLMARCLAQGVALQALVRTILAGDETARREARAWSCSIFEALYSAASLNDRAHLFVQRGIAELEAIFRDPPKSDEA